jgi:hypothetical protein
MLSILLVSSPRTIPFNTTAVVVATMYADAYYEPGDRAKQGLRKQKGMANGWGTVCRVNNHVTFALGRAPEHLIRAYCPGGAYIYFLELLAQLLNLLLNVGHVPERFVAFCDNSAGQSALVKGYGSDARINNLISIYWAVVAHRGLSPDVQWVASELNISDPISRGDTSIAVASNWKRIDINLTVAYDILTRAADDMAFATGPAAAELLNLFIGVKS